jgi:hypothetical protein
MPPPHNVKPQASPKPPEKVADSEAPFNDLEADLILCLTVHAHTLQIPLPKAVCFPCTE